MYKWWVYQRDIEKKSSTDHYSIQKNPAILMYQEFISCFIIVIYHFMSFTFEGGNEKFTFIKIWRNGLNNDVINNIFHLGLNITRYKIIYTGIYIHGVTRCDCIKFRAYVHRTARNRKHSSKPDVSFLSAGVSRRWRVTNGKRGKVSPSAFGSPPPDNKMTEDENSSRSTNSTDSDRWSMHIDGAKYLDRMSPCRSMLHIRSICLIDTCQIVYCNVRTILQTSRTRQTRRHNFICH